MSFALALLAVIQAVAPAGAEDEIVVIARRFEQVAVHVGKDEAGRFTCGLSASSGSPRLDERLCKAASRCVIKGAADSDAVKICIDRKKPSLLAQSRAEYRGSRL